MQLFIVSNRDRTFYFANNNTRHFAFNADGSLHRSTKAYSSAVASIYETLALNDGDSSVTKKLLGVTVMTEPMPSSGQIVLKYRKNEDIIGDAWTTIFTHTTDDSISHSAINIESSGATLPEYKEIQFKIESTGGAVITGLKYKSEVIDKDLY
jgi:hypothetical protein